MRLDKQSIWWPIVALFIIASCAIAVSLWLQFQAAYQRQLHHLGTAADTLANLMEAVAQHDRKHNTHLTAEQVWQLTLKQIEQGLMQNTIEWGDEELIVGYRDNNVLKIIRKSTHGPETLPDTAYDGKFAQALYRALKGQRGHDELLDYSGERVLAGYAPVPTLGIGIALKIPREQMLAPLIRSALWAAGIMLFMVSASISGFIWYRHRLITKLGESNKKLQQAEILAQTIIDNTSALLLVLDKEGRIRQFNPACEKLSGYSFAEIEGKFPWETVIPAEDAETVRKQAFEALTHHPQQLTGSHTNAWVCKNGARPVLHWSNSLLFDAQGKVEYIVSVGTDISEKAEIENRLREQAEIIDQIHDSVVATDLDGHITYWNKGAERMFGYTADEIMGKPVATIYPRDQHEVLQNQIIKPLKLKGLHEAEVILQKKNGDRFNGHVSLSLIYDAKQRAKGMIRYTLDITDRKQAELAMHTSTVLLNSIIEQLPLMVFMKRAENLNFILFNRAGEELTGIDRNQLLGKTDYDFFPKEQADFFSTRDRNVLEVTGYEDIPEEIIDTKTHGRRILHTRKVAIMDVSGKPTYLLGISEDITERKRNQDVITTSNQLLNAILDTTPVLIAHLDTNMNFVRVNQAYADADHKSPEYFIGKNHFDLYPNKQNETIFHHVIKTGVAHVAKARAFEYEHNPERGVTHWDWTLTPVKDNTNNVTGLVLSLLNVTERIQALETIQRNEALLKDLNQNLEEKVYARAAELKEQIRRNELILGTTLDSFFAADATGRIHTVNAAFCNMLGYTSEELLNMHIPQFEANEKAEDVAAHIQKIISAGHDRFDTRHRRKDGHIIDVEISVNLVEIGGEKMFYAFARDITPRKQTEAALMAARDEAEQANHAKSEFLSRMSHELRTPMNAILGFTQVLQMEELPVSQQSYVQEIQDAGTHLLALINELLDMSRIEAGKLAIAIQTVNIREIVTQATHIVRPLMDEKNVTLINECKSHQQMLADPVRLRQILVNLLSNSAKFNTRYGFIHIDCQRDNEELLCLSITDTGIGISPENIDKLFQPFERLGAENSGIDGTGIGLALSRQLAELMGGSLTVDSSPNTGATFMLKLPLASTPEPRAETISDSQPDLESDNKKIVLYIEDNSANLKVVEALFQHHPNMRLLSATNGRYGIELAQHYQPAAILLDIHLPDISGYTVLSTLKSNTTTKNIPVIALSADAMPLDIEKGLEAGFDDYLTKPVKIDHLMSTLEKALTTR